MTEKLRQELCRVGASLFARGHVHSTAGNLSARIGSGTLITPSDACLGFLDPTQLALVDDAGALQSGERASKTLALHRAIYAADPAARCVIHSHSTHLVALTLAGVWSEADVLPPITPYYAMKVGHVPLVKYHRPGDPAVAQQVAALITAARKRGKPIRAVLLERLGPVVWHESPAAAMALLEELEETARLWLMTTPKPAPLSTEQLVELRTHFNAPW